MVDQGVGEHVVAHDAELETGADVGVGVGDGSTSRGGRRAGVARSPSTRVRTATVAAFTTAPPAVPVMLLVGAGMLGLRPGLVLVLVQVLVLLARRMRPGAGASISAAVPATAAVAKAAVVAAEAIETRAEAAAAATSATTAGAVAG